jgi:DNA-directed RNA polymerase sigma subunit (sigma70/sigma32)
MQLKDYISARHEEVSLELKDTVDRLRGLKGQLEKIPTLEKDQRVELVGQLQDLQTKIVAQKMVKEELKHLLEIK